MLATTFGSIVEPGWHQVKNNKRPQMQKPKVDKDEVYYDTTDDPAVEPAIVDKGEDLKLSHKWKVFVHRTDTQDWTLPSYDSNFFIIDSVSTFLQFFSNFQKFNFKLFNMFIMKQKSDSEEFIAPVWEDPMNRSGSTCSIRVDTQSGIELMQQLCILIFNDALTQNPKVINGVSYSVKTQYAIIKIWLSTTDSIAKSLPDTILQRYGNLNVRCKPNEPEY